MLVVINSELQKLSEPSHELLQRFGNLQKQFKVKSSFISGYQLKQLREVNIFVYSKFSFFVRKCKSYL